jgi:hypothetical protein
MPLNASEFNAKEIYDAYDKVSDPLGLDRLHD